MIKTWTLIAAILTGIILLFSLNVVLAIIKMNQPEQEPILKSTND